MSSLPEVITMYGVFRCYSKKIKGVESAAMMGSVRAGWGKRKDTEIMRGGFWAAMCFTKSSVNWEHVNEKEAFGRSPRR